MRTETLSHYLYRIDAADRITFVSPGWLGFAEANEAPELTADFVVGRPIWDFITGSDTRIFYQAIFHNLRFRRAEITIPFRCDSPTVVRQMTLILRLLEMDAIECRGILLHTQIRTPITILFRWQVRSNDSLPICSLCRRLAFQNEWMEVHEAMAHGRFTNISPPPRLEETVCPMCNCLTE